jgi:hypothetical protein
LQLIRFGPALKPRAPRFDWALPEGEKAPLRAFGYRPYISANRAEQLTE